MPTIAITRRADLFASDVAAFSQTALDRPLSADAELLVAVPQDDAVVLGAFQRKSEVPTRYPMLRRGTGGAAARVGPGSVWVSLALANVNALMPCPPDKILNRYVRPLLRALGPSQYFGRDWISVAQRPAALVAYAYSTTTKQALFEAIIGVNAPFALAPRASFLGKEPVALGQIDIDAILDAYGRGQECYELAVPHLDLVPVGDDPPWAAIREEPIGLLAAGRNARGRMCIGGEIMASREGIARVEETLAQGRDPLQLGSLMSTADVPFGFSMESLTDVVVEALRRQP